MSLRQPPMEVGVGVMVTDTRQRTPVLGANLVNNPTFLGISGWTGLVANLSAVANELNVAILAGLGSAYQDVAVKPNTWYRVSVSGRVVTAADADLRLFDGGSFVSPLQNLSVSAAVSTEMTTDVFATQDTMRMQLAASGSLLNIAAFGQASVREIIG